MRSDVDNYVKFQLRVFVENQPLAIFRWDGMHRVGQFLTWVQFNPLNVWQIQKPKKRPLPFRLGSRRYSTSA